MNPFVTNPKWTPAELCHAAQTYLTAVMELWRVPVPKFSSRPPLKTRKTNCNWPGGKEDRTHAGTLALDCGYQVVHSPRFSKGLTWEFLWPAQPVVRGEATAEEGLAETLRLYALNPDLLRLGSPRRYMFLRDRMHLPPPHTFPWERILTGAPQPVVESARKWVEKKKR